MTEGAALGFVAVAIVGYARAHGGLAVASMGLHAAPLAVTPVDDQETPPAAGAYLSARPRPVPASFAA